MCAVSLRAKGRGEGEWMRPGRRGSEGACSKAEGPLRALPLACMQRGTGCGLAREEGEGGQHCHCCGRPCANGGKSGGAQRDGGDRGLTVPPTPPSA